MFNYICVTFKILAVSQSTSINFYTNLLVAANVRTTVTYECGNGNESVTHAMNELENKTKKTREKERRHPAMKWNEMWHIHLMRHEGMMLMVHTHTHTHHNIYLHSALSSHRNVTSRMMVMVSLCRHKYMWMECKRVTRRSTAVQ